jgi:hypothetical protein
MSATQEILLKIQAAEELGAWAKLTTICKQVLDIVQFTDTDQEEHSLCLAMSFTEKSGYGTTATNGLPQLYLYISIHMLEVRVADGDVGLLHPFCPGSLRVIDVTKWC